MKLGAQPSSTPTRCYVCWFIIHCTRYTSFTTVSMAKNLSDWSYVHPSLLTPIEIPIHPMENHYTYIHLVPSKSQWIPWVLSQVLPWNPMSNHQFCWTPGSLVDQDISAKTPPTSGWQCPFAARCPWAGGCNNSWQTSDGNILNISWGYRFHGFSWD